MNLENREGPIDIEQKRIHRVRARRLEILAGLQHKEVGRMEGDNQYTQEITRMGLLAANLERVLTHSASAPEEAARLLHDFQHVLDALKSTPRGRLLAQLGQVLQEAEEIKKRALAAKYGEGKEAGPSTA